MDEKETPRDDGLNLHDESGMTRRDLMRRGAVVGGTLLWVAPAIQSIGSKAYAQVGQGPSPGNCAACYCYRLDRDGNLEDDVCTHNGVQPGTERFSADACDAECQSLGFPGSKYCSGTETATSLCQCTLGVTGTSVVGDVVCPPA